MKRQTRFLIILGTLIMGFTLFTRNLFEIPQDMGDFIKGLGVAFVLSALFVQKKIEKKSRTNPGT